MNELAEKLREHAQQMYDLGCEIEYYGGFNPTQANLGVKLKRESVKILAMAKELESEL